MINREHNKYGGCSDRSDLGYINNPDYLNVYLGNNGRLALELPGALAISKDARVAANKNLNADEILKDKKFTF